MLTNSNLPTAVTYLKITASFSLVVPTPCGMHRRHTGPLDKRHSENNTDLFGQLTVNISMFSEEVKAWSSH